VIRIAILASGAGSNAANILEYFKKSNRVKVVLIATNKPKAGVLQFAEKFGVESLVFDKTMFHDSEEFLSELKKRQVDFIILAGFLWKVPSSLIEAFPDRIINIHPALLPKFGGKGMFGHHVHEAVYQAREKESGITIHFVNEHYDEGKIIFQEKFVILPNDGPQEIENKVRTLEMKCFPEIIEATVTRD
jgi:phosphoribosylglycinamide formyltransferase 1